MSLHFLPLAFVSTALPALHFRVKSQPWFWTTCFQNTVQCPLKLQCALNFKLKNKNTPYYGDLLQSPAAVQKKKSITEVFITKAWLASLLFLCWVHVCSAVSHLTGLSSGSSGSISYPPNLSVMQFFHIAAAQLTGPEIFSLLAAFLLFIWSVKSPWFC